MSNNRLKPQIDKYEVALFATAILVFAIYYLNQYLRFPLDHSLLTGITIILAVALLLIAIVYHIDRENDWKKQQQVLTASTPPKLVLIEVKAFNWKLEWCDYGTMAKVVCINQSDCN